jgi:TolA-binding protein
MKFLMAGAVAALLMASTPSWAQMETREGIALQNQILELRRDIQTLRADPGRSDPGRGGSSSSLGGRGAVAPLAGGSEMTAVLLDRVDRLENAVRQLNGRLDEMDNARQRQGADLAKQIGDLQFRLDSGGGAAPGRQGATTPAPTMGPAPASLGSLPLGASPAAATAAPGPVRRTPELALQEGNAALARRDYAQAEASAREVIAVKASPRAYDGQFLLAQAMSGQRNFPQAAVAFGDTYDRNKQGAHAQDSLVGLAASLAAINEKRSACAALDTLKTQYPSPRPDIAARATALRTSAACR